MLVTYCARVGRLRHDSRVEVILIISRQERDNFGHGQGIFSGTTSLWHTIVAILHTALGAKHLPCQISRCFLDSLLMSAMHPLHSTIDLCAGVVGLPIEPIIVKQIDLH